MIRPQLRHARACELRPVRGRRVAACFLRGAVREEGHHLPFSRAMLGKAPCAGLPQPVSRAMPQTRFRAHVAEGAPAPAPVPARSAGPLPGPFCRAGRRGGRGILASRMALAGKRRWCGPGSCAAAGAACSETSTAVSRSPPTGHGGSCRRIPRRFVWPPPPSRRGAIHATLRWPRLFGQLSGQAKVYSGCFSGRHDPLESIFLLLLLRLWRCGQGA